MGSTRPRQHQVEASNTSLPYPVLAGVREESGRRRKRNVSNLVPDREDNTVWPKPHFLS